MSGTIIELEQLIDKLFSLYENDTYATKEFKITAKEASKLLQEVIQQEDNEFYKMALEKVNVTIEEFRDPFYSKLEETATDEGNHNSLDLKRKACIEDTILQPGKIGFGDVAGLYDAKRLLREAIILPTQLPHLFTSSRKPWRRILLFGPPGTGKSRLAHAISSEITSTFYSVSSSDLLSSWFGESEKLIKELFTHAKTMNGHSVIFIDEIDSLCRKRFAKEEEQTRRIKTELLKQMENSSNLPNQNMFLICATNCPWELDTAFLRRFEKRIYVPLPNRETRKELIKIHINNLENSLDENDFDIILDQTHGFSGSDLATCIADASFEPIRELTDNIFWCWSEDGKFVKPCLSSNPKVINVKITSLPPNQIIPREITLQDVLKSLKTNHKTVPLDELLKYEEFTNVYGQTG